ncbi:hypothetical protein LINGRAHAP2_LOCUS11734 [Linum grandiflorum]
MSSLPIKRRLKSFAAATSKRLLALPLSLESFTITVKCEDLGQEFYQLLSSASIGVNDSGSRSPRKVVVKIDSDVFALFERGEILLKCGRTEFLHLKGLDLSRFDHFKTCLYNLQQLCLEHVQVSQQTFPSCLANAPRLEKLSLVYIEGIDSLDISASNFPSLKALTFLDQIIHSNALKLSSAPLLQNLCFEGNCELLEVVSAPCVKSLELSLVNGELSRIILENLISKFPSLESLYFNTFYISGDNKLRISSGTLRELTLVSPLKLEFEIDAPNLVTLTIKTSGLNININSTVVSVAPSCRCVFASSVGGGWITTSWFIELRKYLSLLATHFRRLVFKLDISYSTMVSKLDMSEVGCELSAPPIVQHLLMGIDLPLDFTLLDGLLWTFRPKTMSVAQTRFNRSLYSYITEQMKMETLEKCCSNCKCWRHQFKDVKIASVTVDNVSMTIDEWMISHPSIDMMFYINRRKEPYYW